MSAEQAAKRRLIAFAIVIASIVLVPWLGHGPALGAAIIASALLGVPLFAIIGIVTILCYAFWGDLESVASLTRLIERIRGLGDQETLLAVPLFMMSGAVMARGQISARLIDFAKAIVGWMPGGLAISAVLACMFFAAISGSSPATVVAIGGMMVPSLIENGYEEKFSQGLLTSAGSLGILIPPSIPMVLFPIVFTSANIQVEHLFAAGFGPGFVIGGFLMAYSFYRGLKDKAKRQKFEVKELGRAMVDGFWSIMFPILILGGISLGVFTAVEAAAISVVYAILVEVWIHGALELKQIPKIFQETGIFLGSLLVIMVAALAFSEFLEGEGIPRMAVEWIQSMHLSPLMFLLIVNLLLLVVGCLMDIMSAMFIFVPLLGPIAMDLGIHPIHFGIIFIVNLEIGYLTPPVGLNLFVASTMFNRPLGHIVRAVVPFIGVMLVGLVVITYVPAVSVGLGSWLMGVEEETTTPSEPAVRPDDGEPTSPVPDRAPAPSGEGERRIQSLEEMMQELEEGAGTDDASDAPSDEGSTDDGSGASDAPPADTLTPAERRNPHRVMSLEEMMEASERE